MSGPEGRPVGGGDEQLRELVARIVDGSDFMDFKPRYGAGTVCLQAADFPPGL